MVVTCCSRFLNLNHVAVPLHDKRVMVLTQQKITKYFTTKKATPKRLVQQKITKYITVKKKLKAERLELQLHATTAAAITSLSHWLQPSFPLGEVFSWPRDIPPPLIVPLTNVRLGPALFK